MKTSLKYFLVGAFLFGSGVSNAQSWTKEKVFVEMADPTADTLSDWSGIKKGLHTSFVSLDQRYAKSLAPLIGIQKAQKITGWKGERISAQLLIWSAEAKSNISIEISEFEGENGRIPTSASTASFIRYVMTDEFAAGCGYRKPEDFAASLSPDMLDDIKVLDLEKKTVRPVWISVDIPRDAKAGKYRANVVVKENGKPTKQDLTLVLNVSNHTLPPVSEWTFHLDQWQHPAAVARIEGVEVWSDAHFEAMKPVMQRLANAGQKVITTTLNKDPWNVQTYDPYADMIIWTKSTDGTWSYDYTVFDRWVSFMMDLGVTKMINCYSIIPWNNIIHYKDAKTGKFIDVEAKPGTATFEEMWSPFLKDFSNHLKEKGWLEITNIAIDERSREQMDAAFKLLKEEAPALGISFADNQKTYERYPESEDISIAIGHPYSKEDIANRTARGLNSTFYICCSDEFANQFTFSDPAESTFLGWYAMASGFNGMLRWAYNSWVANPLHDSRFRTWPAGDTYVVYPQGRSSIRFERMLEGIQDYEKIRIILEDLKAKNNQKGIDLLNKAIKRLDNPRRTRTWNSDLNAAKALLNSF